MGNKCLSSVNTNTDKISHVKTLVDDLIANNRVMVFSKTYCPYCRQAKQALSAAGANDVNVLEIENHPDMSMIQSYLAELTGARSVPRVFINGAFIGGGSETAKLHADGKLSELVK